MARPALPQLLLSVWLQEPHPSAQAAGSEPTGSAGTCHPQARPPPPAAGYSGQMVGVAELWLPFPHSRSVQGLVGAEGVLLSPVFPAPCPSWPHGCSPTSSLPPCWPLLAPWLCAHSLAPSLAKVPAGRLCCPGLHQRLPGHLLPALRAPSACGPGRDLQPAHGGHRGLPGLLRVTRCLQALGVQPAPRTLRARPLLREDPALHSLLAGLRVPAGGDLLLHLCPQPRERRAVPEATSGRLLQGNDNKACDRSSQISASWERGVGGHRVTRSQHRAGHAPAPRPLPQPRPHPPPPPVALTPPPLSWGGVSLLQSWGFLDFVSPKRSKQPTPRCGLWGGRLRPSSLHLPVPRAPRPRMCRSQSRPVLAFSCRRRGWLDGPFSVAPAAASQTPASILASLAPPGGQGSVHPGNGPLLMDDSQRLQQEGPCRGGVAPPRLAHSQRPRGEPEDPVGSGPAGYPGAGPPSTGRAGLSPPEPRHSSAPGAGRPLGNAPRSGEADLSSVKTPLWAMYSSYFCICVSD